ncbi:MAG: YdeI/OmpD-associated family protein [Nanoarchaeota archaeon]|nr:YdeI/OmpD-associated family protein [Nanoarchaeota archaeon]MBU1622145.1 YdeI/OmpD-associated family protein [Nanoarchaeota archaeon]
MLSKINDDTMKTITAFNRDDFRKWLVNHHDKENKVSVIVYKKHTGKSAPSHRELIEEAICFGWIDTTIKRLDEDMYVRNFSKRNKNSKWSDNTLQYAKDLIKQGKMTSVGLKFYKEGLKRPTHDSGIPKNPDMPVELKKALDKDKKAKDNFENFSASTKKMAYRWILRGKREETRNKRIKLIVENSKVGNKNFFGTQEKVNL